MYSISGTKIMKVKSVMEIGHRTAAKNRCAQSIWGLNFGQTRHEIACRDWDHWGNAEKGGNKTLLGSRLRVFEVKFTVNI